MAQSFATPCCEGAHRDAQSLIDETRCSCCTKVELGRLPHASSADAQPEILALSVRGPIFHEARVTLDRHVVEASPRALDPPPSQRQRASLGVYLL